MSKKSSDDNCPSDQVAVQELVVNDSPPEVVTQPLDKNAFNNLSAFGFCFSVLNTWVVLVVGLGASLMSGGPSAGKSRAYDLVWIIDHSVLGIHLRFHR